MEKDKRIYGFLKLNRSKQNKQKTIFLTTKNK